MMNIRGRIVSRGTLIADAAVRISLVKRSDGAEIGIYDGRSVDNGTFEVTQNVLAGLPCNSQNFEHVKYSVEKAGHHPAQGTQPIVDEDTNMGDIELARKALRVHGRVTSNGRPVRAATVIVSIDDVERASIRTNHEGIFQRDIEGSYESRKLVWTSRRFGYISATGSISEIRSNEIDLREIDLTPHWWTGLCLSLGVDPRVALGVLLILGIALALWVRPPGPSCLESTVTAADFQKKGASVQDREEAFDESTSLSSGKCGKDKDDAITREMEKRGYTFSK